MQEGRDSWWHEDVVAEDISSVCEPESMDAEDILFILYTSGSTGKPKGVVHTTGGYLLYAMHTCQYVFDLKDDDVYWCTADIGWITGHTYVAFGAGSFLANRGKISGQYFLHRADGYSSLDAGW